MPTFTVLFFESWFDTFDRGSILLLSLPWSFLGELWIHCVVSVRFVPYNTHLDHMYFTCFQDFWLRSQVVLLHATLCTGRGKRRGLATDELQTVECRSLRLTDEFISKETLGSEIRELQLLMVRPKRPKMLMKLQEKPNLQRHQTFVRLDDLAEELAQVRGLSFKSSTCCRCWTSNIHHLSQATSWRQWFHRVDSSFGLWN